MDIVKDNVRQNATAATKMNTCKNRDLFFFSPPFYGYFVAAGASTLDLICYTSIVSSRKFEILGSHLSLLYVFVYHESISRDMQSGKEIWNFLKT